MPPHQTNNVWRETARGPTAQQLANDADEKLFRAVRYSTFLLQACNQSVQKVHININSSTPMEKSPDQTCSQDYHTTPELRLHVTPVLSRTLERIIVRTFLYPAITIPPAALDFADQYAFRPTGSTTAAPIVAMLHSITELLSTNP